MSFFANWRGKRAYWHQMRKRADRALAGYQKAFAAGADDNGVLCAYCMMLVQRGEPREAIRVIERALANREKHKPPIRSRTYINAAIAYWKGGELDKAIQLMNKAYKLTPNSTVYGTLGYFLIARGDETGDYQPAWEFNRKGLSYDEQDAVVLDNIGQLYAREKDYEQAIAYFRRALEHRPAQTDSRYFLALCLLESGQTEEAREVAGELRGASFKQTSTVTQAQAEALLERLASAG